jgi:hypothetical protein
MIPAQRPNQTASLLTISLRSTRLSHRFSWNITNDHLLPTIQARSAQTKEETKEKTHVIEEPSTTRYTEKAG